MRNLDRMLTLVSEGRKDGSVVCSRLCVFECGMDSILTKAFDGVTLQVGCSSMILQVLIMMNAFMTLALAFLGNTLEKMILPASVITNEDVTLAHRSLQTPQESSGVLHSNIYYSLQTV